MKIEGYGVVGRREDGRDLLYPGDIHINAGSPQENKQRAVDAAERHNWQYDQGGMGRGLPARPVALTIETREIEEAKS